MEFLTSGAHGLQDGNGFANRGDGVRPKFLSFEAFKISIASLVGSADREAPIAIRAIDGKAAPHMQAHRNDPALRGTGDIDNLAMVEDRNPVDAKSAIASFSRS